MVLEGEPHEAVIDPVEPFLLEPLAPEGLDDLVPRERFLEHDVQLAHLLLRALADLVELAPDRAEQHAHRGKDGHRDEGEHPLPHEHDGEEGEDGPHLTHGHDEHGRREPGEAIDVVDHPGHQLGRVHLRIEGQRHALDMAVELSPDPRDHALSDGGHEVGLPVAGKALDEVGAEEDEGKDLEHEQVALEEDVVHGRLDQPGDEAFR